jgi:hypothetical protein
MEKFDRTKNYLVLLEKVSENKGLYRCGICNYEKILPLWKIRTNHDKTCGCVKGKRDLKIDIRTDGNIVTDTGIIMNTKMAKGYEGFKSSYVHRLVATKYLPNPNNYTDVNHINGIKTDNRVENLEWCTRAHNLKHAVDTGLRVHKKGRIAPNRIFTKTEIEYIRTSNLPSRAMASELNVSKTTILRIRNKSHYNNF